MKAAGTTYTYLSTFRAVFEEHAERGGQRFTVLAVVDADEHDDEILPMVRIRFEDGTEITAHPEEVVDTINGEWLKVVVGGRTLPRAKAVRR